MSNKLLKQDIHLDRDEGAVTGGDFYLGAVKEAGLSRAASSPCVSDEAEMVKTLLHQVHQVTDQFFHTTTANSLKKAISLGFNGRQFTHYLLDSSSCDENCRSSAVHDHRAHLGAPMWDAMKEFENEIPEHVRLTDGIRFVCQLRDLFIEWGKRAVLVSRVATVHDLLRQMFEQKGAARKADMRLMTFTLDILATLAEVHK